MRDNALAGPYDLVIEAGRVVCPAQGYDGPAAVAVRDGRIAALGRGVERAAKETLRFPDDVLLPGLVDLHAHPARDGSAFGVEPDRCMLRHGTTTAGSQGDAGAGNIANYVAHTIRASGTRIRLAINLSRVGESTAAGCFANLEDADVEACTAAIDKHRGDVWGIAVNVSRHACPAADPREVLRRGLEVASRTGLPLLFGMRCPEDWPLAEQLERLRPGDVVTYCFRRRPHCIVDRGRVLPEVRKARERGVLFDVGHGMASFDFEVAQAAIADGFAPDTISTDLQARHTGQDPPHDLPLVMSKLQAAGMPERDVIAAVTSQPAKVLDLQTEIGSLAIGACADLTVLRNTPGAVLADCEGKERSGLCWQSILTIRAGLIVAVAKK